LIVSVASFPVPKILWADRFHANALSPQVVGGFPLVDRWRSFPNRTSSEARVEVGMAVAGPMCISLLLKDCFGEVDDDFI